MESPILKISDTTLPIRKDIDPDSTNNLTLSLTIVFQV